MHARSHQRFISLINLSGLTEAHPYLISCWHPLPASNHIASSNAATQTHMLLLSISHWTTGGPPFIFQTVTKRRADVHRGGGWTQRSYNFELYHYQEWLSPLPFLEPPYTLHYCLLLNSFTMSEWHRILRHCFLLLRKRRFNGHQFNWKKRLRYSQQHFI
jgi:hypothetical protein